MTRHRVTAGPAQMAPPAPTNARRTVAMAPATRKGPQVKSNAAPAKKAASTKLAVPNSTVSASKPPPQPAVSEEARALFNELDVDKDSFLSLKEFAAFIKAKQEEFAFEREDALGLYIKKAFAAAGAVPPEKKVGLEGWSRWLPTFLDYYEGLIREDDARIAAKAQAKADEAAAAKAASFSGPGPWPCKLAQLLDALFAAWSAGKTPLLIDCTWDEGAQYSQLETFYSYSGHQLLELKKMVVEVNLKKTVTLEEAQEQARRKVTLAMHRGCHLIVLCANAAPPFTSKFSRPDCLPLELLDCAKVSEILGVDAPVDWRKSFAGALPRDGDTDRMHYVHKDFGVVVVTRFSPEDYEGFLAAELPLSKLQPIVVTVEQ